MTDTTVANPLGSDEPAPRPADAPAAAAAKRRWIPFEEFMPAGKRVHLERGRLYHVNVRRAARRYNKKLRNAKLTIGRAREKLFVVAFARRMLAVAMSGRGAIATKEIRDAAVEAAADAGYQKPGHGARLYKLPRIQAAVDEAFTQAKFSIAEAAAELAGIAKNRKNDVNARIRAIELRFKLTTGLATVPQVGKLKVEHEYNNDRLFDASQMQRALPVAPVEIEGGYADNESALGGDQEAARGGAVGKKRPRKRRRDAAA